MTLIATFVPVSDGFTDHIKTLLLETELTSSVLRKPSGENPPEFFISLGEQGDGPVVGAARRRTTDKGVDFIAVRIDDPSFGRPIFVGPFPSEHTTNLHKLYWIRLDKQEGWL